VKTFKVGEFEGRETYIGKDAPIFIMAEIGVTCNYEMDRAKKLIDVAVDSGANAVKLAFHFPEDLLSDHTVEYTYPTVYGNRTENMYEMFNYLRFTFEEWTELKAYADSKNIFMFASIVGGFTGIEWAEALEFPMHKIGAWDLLDVPLWRRLVKSGKPLIIDVGSVTEEEMSVFMDIIEDLDTVLLHEYHSHDFVQMNLESIPYIEERFNTLVGFSSPDRYDVNDFMSIALGAVVLEKRLTLDRGSEGHHHILGKEPNEFKEWVSNVRQAEAALGTRKIQPSDGDIKERERFFKRVVATKDIPPGEVLTSDNVACRRPQQVGDQIGSRDYDLVIGKVAKVSFSKNQPITVGSFE